MTFTYTETEQMLRGEIARLQKQITYLLGLQETATKQEIANAILALEQKRSRSSKEKGGQDGKREI